MPGLSNSKASFDLQIVVLSAHLCRSTSYPLHASRVICIKIKRKGALKPGRLGLSYKINNCSDSGTGGLGVLATHESSLMKMTT